LQNDDILALTRGKFSVSLQIGINSGDVVESILGKRLLPRYKLFGDAVNTASRMKSTGLCGRINTSRATHDLLMRDADSIIAVCTAAQDDRSVSRSVLAERFVGENEDLFRTSPQSRTTDRRDAGTSGGPNQLQCLTDLDVAFAKSTGFFLRPRRPMQESA
jgi:class 3 adenylate cyclase